MVKDIPGDKTLNMKNWYIPDKFPEKHRTQLKSIIPWYYTQSLIVLGKVEHFNFFNKFGMHYIKHKLVKYTNI